VAAGDPDLGEFTDRHFPRHVDASVDIRSVGLAPGDARLLDQHFQRATHVAPADFSGHVAL